MIEIANDKPKKKIPKNLQKRLAKEKIVKSASDIEKDQNEAAERRKKVQSTKTEKASESSEKAIVKGVKFITTTSTSTTTATTTTTTDTSTTTTTMTYSFVGDEDQTKKLLEVKIKKFQQLASVISRFGGEDDRTHKYLGLMNAIEEFTKFMRKTNKKKKL